ncbi:MAG: glycoside hydrolase [Chloroflexi bacterium]|nr:glycoside hydrolase [Chloroflexota bacterium]
MSAAASSSQAGSAGSAGSAGAGGRSIGSARVEVDAGRRLGELPRPWTTVGYDELNWTYTPRGKRALATFASFAERPYYVRAHNLLTSGRGFSWPHWGSGNVYHEDAAGNPVYDWTIVDLVFDAYHEAGFKPIVELGFTPHALVPPDATLPFTRSPSQYGPYEAGLWSFPPRDNARWQELMYRLARHCVARYGADEVAAWYWELWNEPNISYWRGTPEQYHTLYDHTVAGLTRALPTIKVGGPAVTGGANAVRFMEGFLAHCAGEGPHAANASTGRPGARLDFISFHTKGSGFGRRYGPLSDDGMRFEWGEPKVEVPRQSPSRRKMLTEIRAHLRAAARYPQFRHLPVLVDECDPCVPAHFSRYDNPNFGFRNTSYYPTIMASVFKRLMDLDESLPDAPDVALATSWAWYFEGERFFEGFRECFTAENVELPLLNGYRVLSRLGRTRLALTSDATWDVRWVDELDADGQPGTPPDAEVDGLAALDEERDGTVAVALWHHVDDQYATAPPAEVTVTVRNVPFDPARARVRHWRIDATHSNAYTIWQEMGRPQDPTPEQLAILKARQGLEEGEPVRAEPDGEGGLRIRLQLPLHAVSLLEIGTG